ncbi:amidase [Aspergillus mulundensis]|uniref:amidase n=1 Tax=Aspergillus mulundensis TaxID=1810919 RepID=A0A3D8QJD1_9EURO|nr:Acetamidase [Aspergillus mulundensis]RDW61821.1 Acetamidase [Aspergillus mulundensis]
MPQSWQDLAADKRARLAQTIPDEWKIRTLPTDDNVLDFPQKSGILTEAELQITESSAAELVSSLASGQLTSVEVTTAFCKRAAIAQQLTNCLLEFFPDAALTQARELDAYYAKHKKPIGPLHGLPISLKDQLRVKGYETSMGYVSWLNQHDEHDSVMTALLRQAGAVFYVKTSVPQTLMVCETVNNIVGRTVNPRNRNWSCGGSSGGEGAIVGIRGGVIGVGTDIGGSIRVPAAFNFLYGLRPSHGRLPYAKMRNSMEGQETVHSVVGPIAHSVQDLRLFTTAVLSQEPWKHDSKVIPLPWRPSESDAITSKIKSTGLNLAYYTFDGNVHPHPPITRGIETTVSALQKAGHAVTPWTPYRHDFGHALISNIYAADGSADVTRDISASGEPAIPNIKDLLNPDMKAITMNELWDTHLQKWTYQMEYLAKWREFEESSGRELDAIIAPITATAAVRHDQFRYYGYASVINLLDFTSVVVPVTFADRAVDKVDAGFVPVGQLDQLVQDEYDPEAYHGAPVAVQVIGRRLSEERTLAIAEEVGRVLGNVVAS